MEPAEALGRETGRGLNLGLACLPGRRVSTGLLTRGLDAYPTLTWVVLWADGWFVEDGLSA